MPKSRWEKSRKVSKSPLKKSDKSAKIIAIDVNKL